MIEIICTVLGLLQGILIYFNKRSNWIVYALQMLFLIIFSYFNSLYGDMIQNIFYFFFCIISFFLWKEGKIFGQIRRLNIKWISIIAILTIVFTLFIGFILSKTDDPLPYIDALTTVTTIIGLILMSMRVVECWIIWFINDLAYIYEYYSIPNQAYYLIFLYIIWTFLAIMSFINWFKIYKSTN